MKNNSLFDDTDYETYKEYVCFGLSGFTLLDKLKALKTKQKIPKTEVKLFNKSKELSTSSLLNCKLVFESASNFGKILVFEQREDKKSVYYIMSC